MCGLKLAYLAARPAIAGWKLCIAGPRRRRPSSKAPYGVAPCSAHACSLESCQWRQAFPCSRNSWRWRALQALSHGSKEDLLSFEGMGLHQTKQTMQAARQHVREEASERKRIQRAQDAKAQRQLGKLCDAVEQARAVYYGAKPDEGVSDVEYDALLQQVRDITETQGERNSATLERARALLSTVGSPPEAPEAALAGAARKGAAKVPRDKESAGPTAIQTVAHTEARGGRLLSLAAVHSADELRTWWRRSVAAVLGPDAASVVEPKVDGLTLRLTYESGRLVEVRRRVLLPAARRSAAPRASLAAPMD